MKNLSFVTVLTLMLIFLASCNNEGIQDHEIKVSGKIENPAASVVSIQKLNNHVSLEREEIKKLTLDDDNNFSAIIDWDEAGMLFLVHGERELVLFMEPGQHIQINTTGKDFSQRMDLSGNAVKSNEFFITEMKRFRNTAPAIQQNGFGAEPETFLMMIDTSYKSFRTPLEEKFGKDKKHEAFLHHQRDFIHYAFGTLLIAYGNFQLQQQMHPLPDNYFDFMDTMRVNNPTNFNNSAYVNFLNVYISYAINRDNLGEALETEKDYYLLRYSIADDIFEDKTRQFAKTRETQKLFLNGYIETGDSLIEVLENEGVDKEFIQAILPAKERAKSLQPGEPAPEFTYPDLDGQEVSLSDFEGKVVYLDVWASWCSPCLREFPYTAQLYETFSDEDVAFLYVSIDREENEWRQGVEEHNLKGINLYAGDHFDAQIMHDYNIRGIPRYIIIDRNGNLFDNNAPRPSGNAEEAIRNALEQSPELTSN